VFVAPVASFGGVDILKTDLTAEDRELFFSISPTPPHNSHDVIATTPSWRSTPAYQLALQFPVSLGRISDSDGVTYYIND